MCRPLQTTTRVLTDAAYRAGPRTIASASGRTSSSRSDPGRLGQLPVYGIDIEPLEGDQPPPAPEGEVLPVAVPPAGSRRTTRCGSRGPEEMTTARRVVLTFGASAFRALRSFGPSAPRWLSPTVVRPHDEGCQPLAAPLTPRRSYGHASTDLLDGGHGPRTAGRRQPVRGRVRGAAGDPDAAAVASDRRPEARRSVEPGTSTRIPSASHSAFPATSRGEETDVLVPAGCVRCPAGRRPASWIGTQLRNLLLIAEVLSPSSLPGRPVHQTPPLSGCSGCRSTGSWMRTSHVVEVWTPADAFPAFEPRAAGVAP